MSFWVARETIIDKYESLNWIRMGVEAKDEFVKMSVSASTWNFENSKCRHLYISTLLAFHFQKPSHALLSNLIYKTTSTELFLLQAEEQFCSLNFELAETLYDAAISSSKIHKFVNEEALANELAGNFYLETGRRNRSVHYFSQAIEKYNEWGAVAKANTLTDYLS